MVVLIGAREVAQVIFKGHSIAVDLVEDALRRSLSDDGVVPERASRPCWKIIVRQLYAVQKALQNVWHTPLEVTNTVEEEFRPICRGKGRVICWYSSSMYLGAPVGDPMTAVGRVSTTVGAALIVHGRVEVEKTTLVVVVDVVLVAVFVCVVLTVTGMALSMKRISRTAE
ncbi:MAG: hypothetical protein Q9218_003039 [Villophora microphyllina]